MSKDYNLLAKTLFFSWKQAFCKIPLKKKNKTLSVYLNLLRLTAFLSVNREVIRYFFKTENNFFCLPLKYAEMKVLF